MIYLDNAATTRIDPEVLDAMMPYLTDEFGNAGSLYSFGRKAADAISTARKQVADCIGAEPEQIIFTSGGTEANNLTFKGLVPYFKENNKNHLVTTKIEHDSILNTVKEMNIKLGFDISFLNVTESGILPVGMAEEIRKAINENTGLVSVMYVNNEIGSVNYISKICELAHEKGTLFHTDCVQALGDVEIDVRKIDCDFLSLSSHKIHGAKGVGALYAKNPKLLNPIISGGEEQEFGYRGGTENVAGIVGFGKACELIKKNFAKDTFRVLCLKKLFRYALACRLDKYGLCKYMHVNGDAFSANKILNIRFDGVDAQTLVLYLDNKGVCVSAGSACRSRESEPSNVLLAIGLTPDEARSSVRISFSHDLSEGEVVKAAKIVADAVKTLSGDLRE